MDWEEAVLLPDGSLKLEGLGFVERKQFGEGDWRNLYRPWTGTMSPTGEFTDTTTDQLTVATLPGNTTPLVNSPILFSGANISLAGLSANTTYYVKSVPSTTALTLSQSRTNGVADAVINLTTAATITGVTADVYVGDNIWKRVQLDSF